MNYAALAARAHVRVSIPFIAGQWSLPPAQTRQSFRPPHVSIPFIAGQWSLLEHYFIHTPVVMPFQSPSLRGSGRFPRPRPPKADGGRRFQSPSLRGSGRFPLPYGRGGGASGGFQSPSLRGSGRFRAPSARMAGPGLQFQSPSLRGSGRFGATHDNDDGRTSCFNPLHCGAVVASG